MTSLLLLKQGRTIPLKNFRDMTKEEIEQTFKVLRECYDGPGRAYPLTYELKHRFLQRKSELYDD